MSSVRAKALLLLLVLTQNFGSSVLILLTENGIEQQLLGMQNRLEALETNCRCGVNVTTPVFTAALSQNVDHCTAGQHLLFDSVKVNKGSAYSPRHGAFKAPVAGTYSFSATLTAPNGQSYHVGLVKNSPSNPIGYLYADGTNIWLQRSTTVFSHLDKNDEVWMACISNSFVEGNAGAGGASRFHSHFSGFLVSAD